MHQMSMTLLHCSKTRYKPVITYLKGHHSAPPYRNTPGIRILRDSTRYQSRRRRRRSRSISGMSGIPVSSRNPFRVTDRNPVPACTMQSAPGLWSDTRYGDAPDVVSADMAVMIEGAVRTHKQQKIRMFRQRVQLVHVRYMRKLLLLLRGKAQGIVQNPVLFQNAACFSQSETCANSSASPSEKVSA